MSKYDSAGLAMIPSGYKASKVYSLIPNSSSGDFDFARSSSATRVNKDGLIETVATNVPRLDYPLIDGVVQDTPSLLLEPSRRNDFTYSDDFSNAAWVGAAVTRSANEIISPDGSQNADKLTASVTFAQVQQSYTSINDADYTLSVFVKSPTSNEIGLRLSSGANDVRRAFNLSTLSISSMGGNNQELIDEGIENYGNGWYRCYLTCKADGTSAFANIYPKNASDGTLQSVYAWGAQLEQGSYATSYIPTSGSTVTRAAETCNGAGTSADFNDSEGVLFLEAKALSEEGDRRIAISDGTTNNRVFFYYSPSGGDLNGFVVAGGTTQAGMYAGDLQLENCKLAIKYKANDCAIWANGFEMATDSVSTMPTGLNQLSFDSAGIVNWYGNTKQLITFKQALTDAELEDLTSWDTFNEMATQQLYTIE